MASAVGACRAEARSGGGGSSRVGLRVDAKRVLLGLREPGPRRRGRVRTPHPVVERGKLAIHAGAGIERSVPSRSARPPRPAARARRARPQGRRDWRRCPASRPRSASIRHGPIELSLVGQDAGVDPRRAQLDAAPFLVKRQRLQPRKRLEDAAPPRRLVRSERGPSRARNTPPARQGRSRWRASARRPACAYRPASRWMWPSVT